MIDMQSLFAHIELALAVMRQNVNHLRNQKGLNAYMYTACSCRQSHVTSCQLAIYLLHR